jgi:hypothetical protein
MSKHSVPTGYRNPWDIRNHELLSSYYIPPEGETFTYGSMVDYRLGEECVSRGLLPAKINEYFQVCVFLARVVVAAQAAQRHFGVPASVLIAKVAVDFGWNSDFFIEFAEHHISPRWKHSDSAPKKIIADAIEYGFFKEAEGIATSKEFKPAMDYIGDTTNFLKKLSELGFRDALDLVDIVDKIEEWDLEQCDETAKLRPGARVSELPYGPDIHP